MLEQTNGDKKIIFDGKANNLVYTDRLYFISKGKLYSYDDILNESAEVNSYTIYYINDETLLGINNKKTKAYIINLSESTETEITINGTDISFENDYLYYRDTNQNVLRISPMSPDNVETVVQYDSDKRMKTPFYAFGDIVFFSDFSSDETGNIYLRRSGADGNND